MGDGTKVLIGGAVVALLGTGVYLATKGASGQNNGGITINIYDSNGNPVTRRAARRGGAVMASSYDLVPGTYSVVVTVTNATMINGVPGAYTLKIVTSANTGSTVILSDTRTQAFAASQSIAFTYSLVITSAMSGTSGTISVSVKDQADVQLATGSVAINATYAAFVFSSLVATKYYSGGGESGTTMVPIKSNYAFYADASLAYSGRGGNYTVLVEINMNRLSDGALVKLRSFKDITLPDSGSINTVTMQTINVDVFNTFQVSTGQPFSQAFGDILSATISLISRGSDWSAFTSIYSAAVSNAYQHNVAPAPTMPSWKITPTPGSQHVVVSGESIFLGSTLINDFIFAYATLGDKNYTVLFTFKKPGGGFLTGTLQPPVTIANVTTYSYTLTSRTSSIIIDTLGEWYFELTLRDKLGTPVLTKYITLNAQNSTVPGATVVIGGPT